MSCYVAASRLAIGFVRCQSGGPQLPLVQAEEEWLYQERRVIRAEEDDNRKVVICGVVECRYFNSGQGIVSECVQVYKVQCSAILKDPIVEDT